jgi:guanine deaminase
MHTNNADIPFIEWVLELFPNSKNYASIYDKFGLLTDKTIMAHCIYLNAEEKQLLRERAVGVSHCPNSNFSISSGICHVRDLLKNGIKVGLGTDVSGGHHPSMLDAIRSAIMASKVLQIQYQQLPDKDSEKAALFEPLTVAEAFYLATKGSASISGLDGVVGDFAIGRKFDAILVDMKQLYQLIESSDSNGGKWMGIDHHVQALADHGEHLSNNIDLWHHDDLRTAFERFIYVSVSY